MQTNNKYNSMKFCTAMLKVLFDFIPISILLFVSKALLAFASLVRLLNITEHFWNLWILLNLLTLLFIVIQHQLNFDINSTKLLWSYLRNRSQSVVHDGEKSISALIFRGDPQRSVLGPILFSLFEMIWLQ